MASLRARAIERFILPRAGSSSAFATPESARAAVGLHALSPARAEPPRWMGGFARIGLLDPSALDAAAGRRRGWAGYRVFDVRPRGADPDITVLFLHGGAYVAEITNWHWYFVVRLARAVPARVVVPIYPLAPTGVAADVVPAVADLLADLRKAGAGRVVLMGDSAGGGLALATALVARDRGDTQRDRTVLLVPWLDVTMSHPDQVELARVDRMLSLPGLREAARLYAGGLPLTDPRVSPLFGDLAGLGPLTVLHGTHDLLVADSRRLVEAAGAAGVEIDYHEAAGMPHPYALLPIPEGRRARALVAEACRDA
jgi:acetyl esterase/lipase